ncbi:ATP-grasp domain-containing protein [Desulfonatronovibrio magnus]|uniref:ATP-grasp domain-containing protein n=1 Tax=Desulfonatronovibrio magnus TaxID=698827 RepID=UPI0005EB6712|nr:hypothetical protein [Desulfonatronovibrio magnus]
MIVRSIAEFRKVYLSLDKGDAFVGNLILRPGEEFKALDLINRGVIVYPSLLSQFLSRSKVFQAQVLSSFMLPNTFVAYRSKDIMRKLPDYPPDLPVVCKRDRKHLGLGLSKWSSLEHLQSLAAMEMLPFPFVVQPFLENARDIRVLIIEDYSEAYEKINPNSFRKNLAQGGTAIRISMPDCLQEFCHKIMLRGEFPYAIMDVLMDRNEKFYLSEISLTGGLTGSRLGQEEFVNRKKKMLDSFCLSLTDNITHTFSQPELQPAR